MIVEVVGLEDQLGTLFACGEPDKALGAIAVMMNKLIGNTDLLGHFLYEPVSDKYLQKLSASVVEKNDIGINRNGVVHVVTEANATGGHTHVVFDIVRYLPEMRHTLILTDIGSRYKKGIINLDAITSKAKSLGLGIIILKEPTLLEKIHELAGLIKSIAPNAIFINAHHYDSVAYGGVSGGSAPRVNFIHHADNRPSLGASRTDYEHYDLTPSCHKCCLQYANIEPKMMNLTVDDLGVAALDWSAPLTGVTCGSAMKYQGRAEFTYEEVLTSLFKAGLQKMHHFGEMPEEDKQRIHDYIRNEGCGESILKFHPNTPSLATELKNIAPHLYLNSHPIGGGKSVVEAFSAGIPVLNPAPLDRGPLMEVDMSHGAAIIIRKLEEVSGTIPTIKKMGEVMARQSRECYDRLYSPARFRESLLAATSPLRPSH